VLKIVTYPDPVLDRPCVNVVDFGPDLKRLADGMAEAMYSSRGVGLASPQVGLSLNFVLVDPSAGESANELVVLANPRITWASPEFEVQEEGCLSLPGVLLSIARPVACDVEYLDLEGKTRSMRCTGWKARIVQHEVEHLLGITMLKKVGPLARQLALKNLARTR
jgi:peptide deformylase